MEKEQTIKSEKRYTLATRAIDLEALLVTGVFCILMVIWACFTEDKRFLFIPLFFIVITFICFVSLIIKFFTEPKIAIQADCNGIYFYYPNNKETFIDYSNIIEVLAWCSYNKYGKILLITQNGKYKSIKIKQDKNQLKNNIISLKNKENKEEYLIKIEIKKQ